MMFTLVFVAITFACFTYAANPEFCKALSQCMTQGEQYFSQWDSLKQQQKSASPVPKTPYEICLSEYDALLQEYFNLISGGNLYIAQCVESRADQNIVANSSLANFNTILNNYVKSCENQTSPTDKVTLSHCKCEQSTQISNQLTLRNKKQVACSVLYPSCSQLNWCVTEKFQKEKNETIVRVNDMGRNVLPQKNAACTALNAPAKPVPKKKREVENDKDHVEESDKPYEHPELIALWDIKSQ